ncbi:hypothetical protein CTEN210_01970 [Chaetoceros tenuissimus]|uniref:GDT1 family protein n=1 Tax=Chaetoceros tenuissimus TaxID=426638 RepID=A0AAD3H079_9STRA|nr:hypothetical protein CTEN210_01970 [Chaetoceros tenuissimus]
MNPKRIFATLCLLLAQSEAFTVPAKTGVSVSTQNNSNAFPSTLRNSLMKNELKKSQALHATPDLEVVALVAGQENYGLAVVALGEAIWSFLEAPSVSHAKVLIPATIAAIVLVAVSGPMVTNTSDPAAIKLGLEIATGVSVGLGASYIARLLSPYSPSAKEIAFLGLLVSIAGFFSFSQNLVVDEFVTLPSLPELPNIFPENDF